MNNNYKCTQDELYEACGVIQLSLVGDLVKFGGFKPKYNVAFTDAVMQAIIDAAKLPDEEQRAAQHEMLLLNLIKRQVRCIDKLQALRLYIKEAYPDANEQRIKLQEAGFNDYNGAVNKNWDKLIAIMIHGRAFVHTYEAALTAGDNMPATFTADFDTEESGLAPLILQFKNTQENSTIGTEEKVKANNAIYKTAMGICEDGVYIFKNEEAKRNQYIWEKVMDLVTPPGAAGLRLDVKEDGTNLPLTGVNIEIQKAGGVALKLATDAEGKGYFESLEVGIYSGKVQLAGYADLEVEFEIKTGVTSFKHWVLVKV